MAEVNEEIIEQYLKIVKKWFYVTDITFKVPNNYSNIDILAMDVKEKKFYDIEVKYRSEYTLSEKNKQGKDISENSVKFLIDQLLKHKSRDSKIAEYTNGTCPVRVLVTTKNMLGKSNAKRVKMENTIKKLMENRNQEIEIWYFDDIIPELFEKIDAKGKYTTQLLQTIRLIKRHVTTS